MGELFFVQRSRIGGRLFSMGEEHIVIAGRTGFQRFQSSFALCDIAPQLERIRARYFALVAMPLGIAAAILAVARAISERNHAISEIVEIFAVCFVVPLLWKAIKGFAPLEIVRFRNRSGAVLFDIVKEKEQAAECDQFVAEICARIRIANGTRSSGN
jgi:hypothetical protein